MPVNPTEMRQERQRIIEELRKLHEDTLLRGVKTGEEKEKMEKMEAAVRAADDAIATEERLMEMEAASAKSQLEARDGDPARRFESIRYGVGMHREISRTEIERHASYLVQGWLRSLKPNAKLDGPHMEAAKFYNVDLRQKEIELPINKNYRQIQREYRALDVATSNKGQETIPEGFVNALETSLLTFGGMRQVADVIRTEMGNDLPWPTANDTSNTGELLGEATSFGSSVDPSFGQVIFKAFKYSSKPVLVSSELLQDSAFDLGARLGEMLGIRIGRIQNAHFTTGAGTTLPKGLIVAAGTFAGADDVTISSDDIIGLEHSVDPAYRVGASFMMHDSILAKVRMLKEATTNAYIWQPGLQAGVPDRLLGYPYTINQQMASTTVASAKVVAFGDMRKYKIRDVASIRLVRLDELYAATDQVGFVAYFRSDGNLLDAGTDPVKVLQLLPS